VKRGESEREGGRGGGGRGLLALDVSEVQRKYCMIEGCPWGYGGWALAEEVGGRGSRVGGWILFCWD
jgi:hypothetical protein